MRAYHGSVERKGSLPPNSIMVGLPRGNEARFWVIELVCSDYGGAEDDMGVDEIDDERRRWRTWQRRITTIGCRRPSSLRP